MAILAVGAVLRVAWGMQAEGPVALRDPLLYLVLSDHVAAGDGYTYGPGPDQGATAYYPPGYPVLLGRGHMAGAAAAGRRDRLRRRPWG